MAETHFDSIEISIVKILIDPFVRSRVGPQLEPEWMFTRNVTKALGCTLLKPDYEGKSPNTDVLFLDIKSNYKNLTATEFDIIVNIVNSYKPIDESDLGPVLNIITNFIKNQLRLKAFDFFSRGQLQEADSYSIRAVNFTITSENFIDPTDEEMVKHLQTLDLPPGGALIKSSMNFVNNALVYKSYKFGDLVCIVSPPKTGKTTYLCQEGVHIAEQGFKVAHMFFGDMSSYDGICKYASNYFEELFKNILKDPVMYTRRMKHIFENVKITSHPAAAKRVQEVISEAQQLRKKFKFDALIIDYDSNIIPPAENMYESGGLLYSAFKGFAQGEGCVVFIASQPKIDWWNKEVLMGECMAESSRKQHVIDIGITFGRNSRCKFIGTALAPYVRRGESMNGSKVHYDYAHSRIKEIDRATYDSTFKTFSDSGDTIDSDIFEDPAKSK